MEEKFQADFFRFLSTQKIRFDVLETALISNNNLECILMTDESGLISKKAAKFLTSAQYLQKILDESQAKNKCSHASNKKLCILYSNGKKQIFTEFKLKEFLLHKANSNTVDCIQRVSAYVDVDKIYKAKAVYLNKNYSTSFVQGAAAINDSLTITKMMDIMILLVRALENSEVKRIVHFELDFIKNYDGGLLLMGCAKCLLVEAYYTLIQPIKAEDDIDLLAKNIPKLANRLRQPTKKIQKNKYYKIPAKNEKEENQRYTFSRGQLRNSESNLNSPIRFTSPPIEGTPQSFINTHIQKFSTESNDPYTKSATNFVFPLSPTSQFQKSSQTFRNPIKRPISSMIGNYIDNSKNDLEEKIWKRKEAAKKFTDFSKPMSKHEKIRKKTHSTSKTLPKLIPAPQKPTYGKDFIELVLKTYCKDQDFPQGEFGMGPDLSSEDFSRIISSIDRFGISNQEIAQRSNQLAVKPVIEESYVSRASTPSGRLPQGSNENKGRLIKREKKQESLTNSIKKMNKKALERMNIILSCSIK